MKSFVNKKIFIESNEYTYRVEHLTLEGTCSTDHGPRNVKIKNLLVDKYGYKAYEIKNSKLYPHSLKEKYRFMNLFFKR